MIHMVGACHRRAPPREICTSLASDTQAERATPSTPQDRIWSSLRGCLKITSKKLPDLAASGHGGMSHARDHISWLLLLYGPDVSVRATLGVRRNPPAPPVSGA